MRIRQKNKLLIPAKNQKNRVKKALEANAAAALVCSKLIVFDKTGIQFQFSY